MTNVKIPQDVLAIPATQYEFLGESIQQGSVAQMYWHLVKHFQFDDSLNPVQAADNDKFNERMARLRDEELELANRHDDGFDTGQDRIPNIQNAARWLHIYECTLERGTVHWSVRNSRGEKRPYTILDEFEYRCKPVIAPKKDEKVMAQIKQITNLRPDILDDEVIYSALKAENDSAAEKELEYGEAAVREARSLVAVDVLPSTWETQWPFIEKRAATSLQRKPQSSVMDKLNDIIIAFVHEEVTE